MRRCSIKARATGLTKMRCGSWNSTGSLRPSLPASSRATSVTSTLAPAHGCAVRSRVVCAAPLRVRACGSVSGNSGALNNGCVALRAVDVVVLEREVGMRFDHAVVVIHLVVEPQRAARLPFRILDQFDGRRAVGDRGESPGEIGADNPVQSRRAVALDQKAALLAARRQSGVRVRRCVLETALAHAHRSAHCRWSGSPIGCRPAPRPARWRARFRPGAGRPA